MQFKKVQSKISGIAAIFFLAGGLVVAQGPGPMPGDPRGVIDRTQGDLRQAAEFERQHGHNKEIARYENAERHLSDFDREFTRGHFDKGKLGAAIDDVKNVVDHNTLDPRERDALVGDLQALRVMKDHR